MPRLAVAAHLAHLFEEMPADDDDDATGNGGSEPTPLPVVLTAAARTELAERAAERQDGIGASTRPISARAPRTRMPHHAARLAGGHGSATTTTTSAIAGKARIIL